MAAVRMRKAARRGVPLCNTEHGGRYAGGSLNLRWWGSSDLLRFFAALK